jgi:hypothetical protein
MFFLSYLKNIYARKTYNWYGADNGQLINNGYIIKEVIFLT